MQFSVGDVMLSRTINLWCRVEVRTCLAVEQLLKTSSKTMSKDSLSTSQKITMDTKQWLKVCQDVGFDKVTVVDRTSYLPIETTNENFDIATSWKDENGALVNENQSLLDSWKYENMELFCFYGNKFNIIDTRNIPPSNDDKKNNELNIYLPTIVNYWYCIENNNLHLFIPPELINLIYEYTKYQYFINLADFNNIVGELTNFGTAYSKSIKYIIGFQSKKYWLIAGCKKREEIENQSQTAKEKTENNKVIGFDSAIKAYEILYTNLLSYIDELDHCDQDSSPVTYQFPKQKKK